MSIARIRWRLFCIALPVAQTEAMYAAQEWSETGCRLLLLNLHVWFNFYYGVQQVHINLFLILFILLQFSYTTLHTMTQGTHKQTGNSSVDWILLNMAAETHQTRHMFKRPTVHAGGLIWAFEVRWQASMPAGRKRPWPQVPMIHMFQSPGEHKPSPEVHICHH